MVAPGLTKAITEVRFLNRSDIFLWFDAKSQQNNIIKIYMPTEVEVEDKYDVMQI